MTTAEVVPAESARYGAALVFLPGLWTRARVWRRAASYLAHRGWECHLLDVTGDGGIEGKARAVTAYVASLPSRAVLLGHEAGALVALRASAPPVLAGVLVSPLVPGGRASRALLGGPRVWLASRLGRPVRSPAGPAGERYWHEFAQSLRMEVVVAADAVLMRDLRATVDAPQSSAALLVLTGDRDPFLPVDEACAFAARLGAQCEVLAGAGHWPHVGPTWQRTVGILHRWLVQRLGEPLLELYAEAMADRDADE